MSANFLKTIKKLSDKETFIDHVVLGENDALITLSTNGWHILEGGAWTELDDNEVQKKLLTGGLGHKYDELNKKLEEINGFNLTYNRDEDIYLINDEPIDLDIMEKTDYALESIDDKALLINKTSHLAITAISHTDEWNRVCDNIYELNVQATGLFRYTSDKKDDAQPIDTLIKQAEKEPTLLFKNNGFYFGEHKVPSDTESSIGYAPEKRAERITELEKLINTTSISSYKNIMKSNVDKLLSLKDEFIFLNYETGETVAESEEPKKFMEIMSDLESKINIDSIKSHNKESELEENKILKI